VTPNGGAERWRLAGLPGARGIAAWADILAVTHLAFDVRATYRTPGTFQGTVTRRRFGELALVDCAASPFLGDRSLAVMGDHPEEIIGFQFVRKGVELVRESRREIVLTAGDVVLWDGLQPTQVDALLASMDGVPVNAHCPHGRPVAVELRRSAIEALFQR